MWHELKEFDHITTLGVFYLWVNKTTVELCFIFTFIQRKSSINTLSVAKHIYFWELACTDIDFFC